MGEKLKSIYDIRNLSKSKQQNILKKQSIKNLLRYFIDDGNYLMEAIKIPTNKVRILQQDSTLRRYKIKDYNVLINLKQKYIKHDCLFWIHKCSKRYKLCKHIGKIFSIMYEEDSKQILKDMILNDWEFDVF